MAPETDEIAGRQRDVGFVAAFMPAGNAGMAGKAEGVARPIRPLQLHADFDDPRHDFCRRAANDKFGQRIVLGPIRIDLDYRRAVL